MADIENMARAALRGDAPVLDLLTANLLVPRRGNFVERPWGGMRIRDFKGFHPLPDQPRTTGLGLGEAFEIAAYAADEEAARYPSVVELADGSLVSLEALLEAHAEAFLGPRFVARHGRCFPLLPKTLDIAELLSVQGHPPGNTEVYIVIEAEPGASLRLGFRRDIDAAELGARLERGLRLQRELLERLGPRCDPGAVQQALKPWFAEHGSTRESARAALGALLGGTDEAAVLDSVESLRDLYWHVLESMNEIPLEAGQVIYNATPARFLDDGREPSAEVHALGNPEGREALVLEIRKPGPTFRAWDNVRFPIRPVNVEAALAALNLRATRPEEFLVAPRPIDGRPGVAVSVATPHFVVEHLEPAPGGEAAVPAEGPHCLHVVRGAVVLRAAGGRALRALERGDSALVPDRVGAYSVAAAPASAEPPHVVRVSLPID